MRYLVTGAVLPEIDDQYRAPLVRRDDHAAELRIAVDLGAQCGDGFRGARDFAHQQIRFDPAAVVYHYNRPGFRNLLRRNYRWGYSAIESKAPTGAARLAWVYRYPALLVLASLPLALGSTAYIVACWLRAGVLEPLLMLPAVLAARLAYSAGLVAGGIRWMRFGTAAPAARARWE